MEGTKEEPKRDRVKETTKNTVHLCVLTIKILRGKPNNNNNNNGNVEKNSRQFTQDSGGGEIGKIIIIIIIIRI